jgi:hypothetical protein
MHGVREKRACALHELRMHGCWKWVGMQQLGSTAQRNGGGANKRAPEWSGHSCAKVWLAIHVHAKDSRCLTAETARKLGTDYSPPYL